MGFVGFLAAAAFFVVGVALRLGAAAFFFVAAALRLGAAAFFVVGLDLLERAVFAARFAVFALVAAGLFAGFATA